LTSKRGRGTILLTGLHGSGKTTIAASVAHARRDEISGRGTILLTGLHDTGKTTIAASVAHACLMQRGGGGHRYSG
ncbi:hypothetical protein T484DRAFT_1833596, partial [Baffinella frigidus]